ncbi:MAG: 4-alpha-glucanotransferase [Acidobacteriota bacterium]
MLETTQPESTEQDFGASLRAAAESFGIQPEYWDIFGNRHELTPELAQRLLQAIGLDASDEVSLRQGLAERTRQEWERMAPPVAVVEQDALHVALKAPDEPGAILHWRLELEGGVSEEGQVEWSSLKALGSHAGQQEREWTLVSMVPLGYHTLRLHWKGVKESSRRANMRLIVCPSRTYLPPFLERGEKRAGLAVSLYGVRSAKTWGCGDFTALSGITDWVAHRAGGSFVALNPLHAIFNRQPYNTSPYLPSTIFYRNFLYLDIPAIPELAGSDWAQRLLKSDRIRKEIEELNQSEYVEYERIARLKRLFLLLVFRDFYRSDWVRETERGLAFAGYIAKEGVRLEEFAMFSALDYWLHKKFPEVWVWPEWPEEYRQPGSSACREFQRTHPRAVLFYKFVQWQIDQQAEAAQKHALDQGLEIGLFHDLPLANDRCGADLWSARDFFVHGCRVGSPPDDFSPNGQDWSFPPPDKERHLADGYRRFADSIRLSAKHGGALRLDHVMRLFRLYWIPDGFDARVGAYVRDNAEDLLRVLALESVRQKMLIVGEDLGTIEPRMREMLNRFGILSYRLFYFERRGDGSLIPPAEYPRQALVSSTTHDLPTLAGYWSGRDIEARERAGLLSNDGTAERMRGERVRDKQHMLDALHEQALLPPDYPRRAEDLPELTGELHNAITGFLSLTPSMLMTLNQEDLTKEIDQQNLPATTHQYPNWRRKMKFTVEQLHEDRHAEDFAQMLRHWLGRSGRTPEADG